MIKLPIVYFDNLRADTVEEITVVRHNEQAEIGTAEIFFEPFGHIQIKVVGRLDVYKRQFLLFEQEMSEPEKQGAIKVMMNSSFGMTGQNKV